MPIMLAQADISKALYTCSFGNGTAKVEYTVCSTRGGTYFTPTGGGGIAADLTRTSGNGAGVGGLDFTPEVYPFMKIVVTETGTANAIAATIMLNIQ